MSGAARAGGAPRPARLRQAVLAVSAALCGVVIVLYGLRPAEAEAIVFAPPWVWAVPGLLLAGLGLILRPGRSGSDGPGIGRERLRRPFRAGFPFSLPDPGVAPLATFQRPFGARITSPSNPVLGTIALWAAYLLITTESLTAFASFRSWPAAGWEAKRAAGTGIRVVSLNCAGGSAAAAAEVAAYGPDVVLLQETPGSAEVEALARRLFGERGASVVGLDTAIAARGELEAAELPPDLRRYFVQARVRLAGGVAAEVVSLRLMPGAARVDLWSPDCWRQQRESHFSRVEELAGVVERLRAVPADVPVIVGGDFNAPAGDGLFRVLSPRLTDAFRAAGVGWGETMMNDVPILRLDQVWVSGHFEPAAVVARRTRHSDHRMVVCDLLVLREGPHPGASDLP